MHHKKGNMVLLVFIWQFLHGVIISMVETYLQRVCFEDIFQQDFGKKK